MDILTRICRNKQVQVDLVKNQVPLSVLKSMPAYTRNAYSLRDLLYHSSSGLITEHKRRSPSKNHIRTDHHIQEVAKGYQSGGACGMSVLTEVGYFGGAPEDLIIARASCSLPLLRKDFMVDPYQVHEAKAWGADVILLIAAALDPKSIDLLSGLAHELGLEVLLEVHDLAELNRSLTPHIDMVGVNNRNLKTFEVSTQVSIDLAQHIPDHLVKISESGLTDVKEISALRAVGYRGFLVGEHLMKSDDPGEATRLMIEEITRI